MLRTPPRPDCLPLLPMKRLLPLLPVLFLCDCTPVRTVYDQYGQEVKESEGATQSDLNSRFEKEFESAFMEKKGQDGVPQTSSNRVSSFQKHLDDSRRMQDEYLTKSYDARRENDSRSVIYAGASADSRYSRDADRREKDRKMAYGSDMRPDFMNPTHGISHSSRYGVDSTHLSSMDGVAGTGYHDAAYATSEADYDRDDANWYVEGRRDKTPQPTITNFRDYYRQSIKSTRELLGRDKKAEDGE